MDDKTSDKGRFIERWRQRRRQAVNKFKLERLTLGDGRLYANSGWQKGLDVDERGARSRNRRGKPVAQHRSFGRW